MCNLMCIFVHLNVFICFFSETFCVFSFSFKNTDIFSQKILMWWVSLFSEGVSCVLVNYVTREVWWSIHKEPG